MKNWLDEVTNSAGQGFQVGLIGGSTFHFFKSLCISPTHIPTACHAARLNAPRIGGKLAAWSVLCNVSHDALVFVRQKNDPWDRIFAPAISSGLLSLLCRRSLRASACFSMFGALYGTVPEVGLIMADKLEADRKLEKRGSSKTN
ncbi:mitochondrial import inner membrane translocase subunit TIM17-3-like [Arachis stenosperma]|uniref:mitochondrial import inner membrane translocase subunit TIM17-3-like n=1 Tax=Arachis stenosperma TaxID=217475 RepID=UPI0025ABEC7F|nr:mitochondrial import inner membrane translocase subunit TIM17-3-like [Arachis stenosperma]